jgi:cytochrome c peroxidase
VLAFVCLTGVGSVSAEPFPQPIADEDYVAVSETEARLGQFLFYDPILSGNRNIACSTCHHPRFATSDGLSLGLGEGGRGLGPDRVADPANLPEQLIPRNAPALFNLGHDDIRVMFHDGRIEKDESLPSGFRTPLGEEMAQGFSGLLSAQTMFPVLSADEMAGHYGENDISIAVRQGLITGPGGAWDLIAQRVAAITDYSRMFEEVYPEIAAGRPIGFTDISNAIAAFIAFEWRADDSPFDAFLRGEAPLSDLAADGFALFAGEAGCITCHSGPLLTDQGFHAMADPQLGPGKAARFETHREDHGRFRVTGRAEDLYAFRTPSLRNVAATGPWGHAGAYSDLAAYLRHHAAPGRDEPPSPVLPSLETGQPVFDLPQEQVAAIVAARTVPDQALEEAEILAIVAFLETLTDPGSIEGRLGIPESVPSGLPVER